MALMNKKVATFLLIAMVLMTTTFAELLQEARPGCLEPCNTKCTDLKKYKPENCTAACTSICKLPAVNNNNGVTSNSLYSPSNSIFGSDIDDLLRSYLSAYSG